ncbi:MAG TPA: amidoligase family protein [Ardenticatenaceae bacterium]|nr:amidoligase family protein [Ardenticatenaceae bacterium]
MNKSHRFGVEVEFEGLPVPRARKVVRAYFGSDFDHLGRTWAIVRDASVRGGFELVTPPIYYADLFILQELVKRLRQAGARRSPTTGLHVHLAAGDLSLEQTKSLVNLYASHAVLVYSMFNARPMRRVLFCQPLLPFAEALEHEEPQTFDELKQLWYRVFDSNGEQGSRSNTSRYVELNLNSYFYRGTIELRAFSSTNHAGRVRSMVLLALALIDKAKTYPGVYPLAKEHKPQSREEALRRTNDLLDILGLIGPEYRIVREHLRSSVAEHYVGYNSGSTTLLEFTGLGMVFEAHSYGALLDQMWDNEFFSLDPARQFLAGIRKRGKTPKAKHRYQRLLASAARYEYYSRRLIRLLASAGLGALQTGSQLASADG